MLKKTTYMCSNCGQEFNTEEECLEHERNEMFEVRLTWIPGFRYVRISRCYLLPSEIRALGEPMAGSVSMKSVKGDKGNTALRWCAYCKACDVKETMKWLKGYVLQTLREGSVDVEKYDMEVNEKEK